MYTIRRGILYRKHEEKDGGVVDILVACMQHGKFTFNADLYRRLGRSSKFKVLQPATDKVYLCSVTNSESNTHKRQEGVKHLH